ncbi:hypothetical protein AMTRI_Chr12g274090 [Amborella trichopoda]
MLDLGVYVDLPTLLQFFIALVVVSLGFLHVIKSAASAYLISWKSFGEEGALGASRNREHMKEETDENLCVVCREPSTKKCARCKAAYCSIDCQTRDWTAGHKSNCKVKGPEDSKVSANKNDYHQRKSSSQMGIVNNIHFMPKHGTSKVFCQPRKVLFHYDEFIDLFNWDNPGLPPCGLLNCGNSCFANVVLQCLSSTRPLVAYLSGRKHMSECRNGGWCLLCELHLHFYRVSQNERPFSPINILAHIPNIGGNLCNGKQEDAHEFMRFAIDTMQSACLYEFGGEKALDPSTLDTTIIQYIFGGYLRSQVKCSECSQISNRYENMMDLTVEIQGNAGSLEECLQQFTKSEDLDGENKYKCDGCNAYVNASKRLTIHQPPNILTIALKRFQVGGSYGKLNKRVTFPEILDLGPYMSRDNCGRDIYHLYAVVVHIDMLNASFFGHYICYTKDARGNWYRTDDCKVEHVELEEVLAQGAYMLLYSRIDVRQMPTKCPVEQSLPKENPLLLSSESDSNSLTANVLNTAAISSTSLGEMDTEILSPDSINDGSLSFKADFDPISEEKEEPPMTQNEAKMAEIMSDLSTRVPHSSYPKSPESFSGESSGLFSGIGFDGEVTGKENGVGISGHKLLASCPDRSLSMAENLAELESPAKASAESGKIFMGREVSIGDDSSLNRKPIFYRGFLDKPIKKLPENCLKLVNEEFIEKRPLFNQRYLFEEQNNSEASNGKLKLLPGVFSNGGQMVGNYKRHREEA